MIKKFFLAVALLLPMISGAGTCLCSKQVVGPRLPLVFDSYAQKWPSVAFDSLNGNYFITWTDTIDYKTYRIRGRLFSSFGGAITGTLEFDSSPSSFTARVLYNSVNQEFLVTWIAARTLYAQIITSDGRLATPKLTVVALSEQSSVDEYKVVLNTVQNEYLLMYLVTKTKRSEIFLQRMDRFGNKIRPAFWIAGATVIRPDVDYDRDSNRYLVSWETEADVKGRIRFMIFNSYLQKIFNWARTVPDSAPNATSPRVVYDPALREFVIFWRECFTCEILHATRYLPDGTGTGDRTLSIGGPIDFKDIRFNPLDDGFVFLYETRTGSSPQLARANARFQVTSKNVATNCQSGFQNGFSSLVYNSVLREFLVVWNYTDFPTQNDDIFAQRIRGVAQPGGCR